MLFHHSPDFRIVGERRLSASKIIQIPVIKVIFVVVNWSGVLGSWGLDVTKDQ